MRVFGFQYACLICEVRLPWHFHAGSFKNAWYQLLPTPRIVVRPKDTIRIEERLDSSLRVRIRNSYLNFMKLPERPKRQEEARVLAKLLEKAQIPWKPSVDHPWRRVSLKLCAPTR